MGSPGTRSFEETGGRFVARLYAFAGVAVAVWASLERSLDDERVLAFVMVCAVGSVVPHFLPWNDHSDLLLRLLVAGAGVVQVVFVPLWIDHPAMLVFPALGTAYAGTVLTGRWVLGQMIPVTVVHLVVVGADQGFRSGLADTVMYAGLWGTIGLVPLWMRGQIDVSNRLLEKARKLGEERARDEAERREFEAERVRDELAERRQLAAVLRQGVEEVGGETDGIEQQSAGIASAVDQLADSLREAARTAAESERNLRTIATTTTESRESVARLEAAGREIVGIVDTITALSRQTNLLALNATVESARAGEAGRGFAVVAREVKELAKRTAQSASGIGMVVDHIWTEVEASSRAIQTVVGQVSDLESEQRQLSAVVTEQTEVVASIATAAARGAESVGRIGQAIARLDQQAAHLTAENEHTSTPASGKLQI